MTALCCAQEMLPELTMLAQNVVNVDRYRFESLCAVGEIYVCVHTLVLELGEC